MRTTNGSVRALIAGIRQAAEQEEYNPCLLYTSRCV